MLAKRNKFLQHEMQVPYVSISKLLWKILVLSTVFNIDLITEFASLATIYGSLEKIRREKHLIFPV